MNKYFALGALAIIGVAACNRITALRGSPRIAQSPPSRRAPRRRSTGPAPSTHSRISRTAMPSRSLRAPPTDAQLDRQRAHGGTGAGASLWLTGRTRIKR